jgi:DNA-binding NarL/FixJ family response regulator
MPRKKKDFVVSDMPSSESASGGSVTQALRALARGLFGKKKTYQPTLHQVAEYYLTPREREVAYLAALGFTDKEIADALGMNFQTVRVHLRKVLLKMELDDPRALRDFFQDLSDEDVSA